MNGTTIYCTRCDWQHHAEWKPAQNLQGEDITVWEDPDATADALHDHRAHYPGPFDIDLYTTLVEKLT